MIELFPTSREPMKLRWPDHNGRAQQCSPISYSISWYDVPDITKVLVITDNDVDQGYVLC
jgi:hypothetical protein